MPISLRTGAAYFIAFGDAFRTQSDFNSQRLQDIGGAAFTRGGAVAVLGHFKPRSGGDKAGSSGYIKAAGAVPARADDVYGRAGYPDRGGFSAHDAGQSGNLIGGLAFNAQGSQESAYLGWCGLPAHDFPHRAGRLFKGERTAFDQSANGFYNHLHAPS
jgi:hypothetical protein